MNIANFLSVKKVIFSPYNYKKLCYAQSIASDLFEAVSSFCLISILSGNIFLGSRFILCTFYIRILRRDISTISVYVLIVYESSHTVENSTICVILHARLLHEDYILYNRPFTPSVCHLLPM